MQKIFHIPISTNRVYGLDILRAMAILFVVIGHGALLLPESFKAIHRWIVFDGVSIFFVLSGYLIGGILIRELSQHKATLALLGRFWIRRWFRTLPNYFLILGLLIILHLYYYPEVHLGEFKAYFVFLQNFNWGHPPYFPEAWSLSIEEWFYIFTPLLLFFALRIFKSPLKYSILGVAIFILVFSLLHRYFRFTQMEIQTQAEWAAIFRKQVLTRLDSLMFGILAAWLHQYFPSYWKRSKKSLFAIGIGIFALTKILQQLNYISISGSYNSIFSFSVIALATALLLPYLSQVKSGSGWLYRSLSRISLISYSMYLINLSLVQGFVIRKINWSFLAGADGIAIGLQYLLFWLLTVGASILIYKYFEIPSTQLRDRFSVKKKTKN